MVNSLNHSFIKNSPEAINKAKTFANIKVEKEDPEKLKARTREELAKIASNISKEKGFIAGQLAKFQKNEWLKTFSSIFTFSSIGLFISSFLIAKKPVEKIIMSALMIGAGALSLLLNLKIIPWTNRLIDTYGKSSDSKIDLDKDLCWDPKEYTKLQRSVKEFLKPSLETPGSTRGDILVLAGDPGLGKTVIAKGIADLAGKKIIQVKLGGEKYVHEIERKITEGFKDAQKANGILFIDEADSLIRSRGSKTGTSWDHAISAITTMFMQRFDNYRTQGVKVILATNDPNDIDQAVLDRSILNPISRPNIELRKQILLKKLEKLLSEKNLANLKSSRDFEREITNIAEKYNLTGRSIESSVSRAKIIAEERYDHHDEHNAEVTIADIKAAFEENFKNQAETEQINLGRAKIPEVLSRFASERKRSIL